MGQAVRMAGPAAAQPLRLAWVLAAALLGSLPAAQAQPRPATLAACAACHGPNGNSLIGQFPSLAGQPRVFIENQLVMIREGLREVPAMQALMADIKDEEIVDLAKHFAAQTPARPTTAVNDKSYAQGAKVSAQFLCGTCHLPNFAGQSQVPRLAGQQEEFLQLSMKQFRDAPGRGRDTIMAATLRGISDADLGHLAHYLTHFKP